MNENWVKNKINMQKCFYSYPRYCIIGEKINQFLMFVYAYFGVIRIHSSEIKKQRENECIIFTK